jgi:uncharacterized membrane protein
MLAVKLVLCTILLINGNVYDAALTWTVITYLLLLAGRFGGCGWIAILLFIPLIWPMAGTLERGAQAGGIMSTIIIGVLFVSALYFDFRDIREAFVRWRRTKKQAES